MKENHCLNNNKANMFNYKIWLQILNRKYLLFRYFKIWDLALEFDQEKLDWYNGPFIKLNY